MEPAIKDKGFTLIELAIVLIVIGILITLGVSLIGPLTKRVKINQTNDIIDAASESLVSYASSNKRLPTTTEFASAVRNPKDAWTKSLFYVTDANLTAIVSPAVEAVCGRSTTNLTVQTCPDAACASPTNTIPNVAFIIISGGANNNNQTAGTQAVSSATTINVYDVDVSGIDDYTGDIGGARPEPYDDLVKWTTLDELRTKAGCAGPQLEIVNNDLPAGFRDATVYDATVFAKGGVPFTTTNQSYRWCIQRTPATAPANLTFRNTANTANIVFSTDCSALAEASWTQSNTVVISGSPNLSGSFNLTFFVRDNNDPAGTSDNIAQKLLVLTIHQVARSTGCSGFRVWNGTGARRDYRLDSVCSGVNNNAEITVDPTRLLNSGEIIERFSSTTGVCTGLVDSITFNQAVNADALDNDCQVNYETTGVTNR